MERKSLEISDLASVDAPMAAGWGVGGWVGGAAPPAAPRSPPPPPPRTRRKHGQLEVLREAAEVTKDGALALCGLLRARSRGSGLGAASAASPPHSVAERGSLRERGAGADA